VPSKIAVMPLKKRKLPQHPETMYKRYTLYIEGERTLARDMTPDTAKLLNRNYERASLSKVWIQE